MGKKKNKVEPEEEGGEEEEEEGPTKLIHVTPGEMEKKAAKREAEKVAEQLQPACLVAHIILVSRNI